MPKLTKLQGADSRGLAEILRSRSVWALFPPLTQSYGQGEVDNHKDSTVDVKKEEAILYHSRGDNKKGHPILKDSGKKAVKGVWWTHRAGQFVISGAKVISILIALQAFGLF